jgi:hypothetical protein
MVEVEVARGHHREEEEEDSRQSGSPVVPWVTPFRLSATQVALFSVALLLGFLRYLWEGGGGTIGQAVVRL